MTNTFERLAPATAMVLTAISLVTPVRAQGATGELADLRLRVEQLETAQSNLRFNLPGSTQVEIYGYAKLGLLFDLEADLGNRFFGLCSLRPGFRSDSNSNAHAFPSRLGFRTSTDTEFGQLKTVIEGNFFGNGGGRELRVRQQLRPARGALARHRRRLGKRGRLRHQPFRPHIALGRRHAAGITDHGRGHRQLHGLWRCGCHRQPGGRNTWRDARTQPGDKRPVPGRGRLRDARHR